MHFMKKNSEIWIYGTEADKKVSVFYIRILPVQLYSDEDVLPRSKQHMPDS